jgi:hypothetical protein
MKDKIIYVVLGLIIGVGAVFIYYQYPFSQQSRLRSDLDLLTASSVSVVNKSGEYYLIAVHPEASEGGGYDVVVKKLPDGRYLNIWRGNASAPPCSITAQYRVPNDLFGTAVCTEG